MLKGFENGEKREMPPDRLFLHMDVLGAKDLIDKQSNKTSLLMEVTEKLLSNKREHKVEFKKADDGIFDITAFDPEISSDSDHINISFPADDIFPLNQNTKMVIVPALVSISAQVHMLALSRGILMRGGIAKGWQCHTGNHVIGKAQADAVSLESRARYPRVIIAEDLVELFTKYASPVVRKDFDGTYFVDYLRGLLRCGAVINDELIPALLNMRSIIADNLANEEIIKNQKIKEKWQWLAETFNEYLDYCQIFESIKVELLNIRKFEILPKMK